MSTGTKELTELLRAAGVVSAKVAAGMADGDLGFFDKASILLSIKTIYQGISGLGKIPAELRDLDEVEVEEIIKEMIAVLAKTKRFTFRERDIAERLLRMVYRDIREYFEIVNLPPTALAV